MNWEVAGAIGEIVASIGVVISLIFVAMQLRGNTHAMQLQSAGLTLEESKYIWSKYLDHPTTSVRTIAISMEGDHEAEDPVGDDLS